MRSVPKQVTIKRTLTWDPEGNPLTTDDNTYSAIISYDTDILAGIVTKIYEFDMSITGSMNQDLVLIEIRNYWGAFYDINDLEIEYNSVNHKVIYQDYDDRLRRITFLCHPKQSQTQYG